MTAERLEITEEHLKLMRRAYVSWEECEYGAPAIDCKRPYGNSAVEEDIAEILGEAPEGGEWGETDLSSEQRNRYRQLHEETRHVLQIWLRLGEIRTGLFEREDRWGSWKEVVTA